MHANLVRLKNGNHYTDNTGSLSLPKKDLYNHENILSFLLLAFTACSSDRGKGFDSLEEIKKDFIASILIESHLDEGPFQMDYHLRAILFLDNVESLMGDVFVFAHLPHGYGMRAKRI